MAMSWSAASVASPLSSPPFVRAFAATAAARNVDRCAGKADIAMITVVREPLRRSAVNAVGSLSMRFTQACKVAQPVPGAAQGADKARSSSRPSFVKRLMSAACDCSGNARWCLCSALHIG